MEGGRQTAGDGRRTADDRRPSIVRRLPFAVIIGTGFGSGYSPIAPGTAGALVGCAFVALLHFFAPAKFYLSGLFFLIFTFFFLGAKAADRLAPEWGHDPSRIVADEMVGLWIAMLWVPFSWFNLALAFGLFRLFDIWKPLGIRQMEKLPGGWGVMMDDVLAGIYSLAVVHLSLFVLNNL